MIVFENENNVLKHLLMCEDDVIERNKEDVAEPVQGAGGFVMAKGILKGDFVGIYATKDKIYFVHQKNHFEMTIENFECENKYITAVTSSMEKVFTVTINNKIVCQIKYIPYGDIGDIMRGLVEVDEFDFLERFSKFLRNKESVARMVKIWRNNLL